MSMSSLPPLAQEDRPPLIRLAGDLHKLCLEWERTREQRIKARANRDTAGAEEALAAEWQIAGEIERYKQAIGQAFLFMLRQTIESYPGAVAVQLKETVLEIGKPEWESLAKAILRLETRRW